MADQEARQMLPEVQKYLETVEAAATARNAAISAAESRYPERYSSNEDGRRQYAAYVKQVNNAYEACRVTWEAAWEALKASSDPLVKWIAENCAEYRGEARHVLAALPATVDELDDLADTQGWCGVWGELLQRAIDAGVAPGVNPPSPARKAVFEQIDQESCCGIGLMAQRRINKALDALMQEALAAQASTTEPPA
ncbi:hypothetical protein AB0H82_11110 [Streptomyces sp. NPDC050732]|uniref:hypothetical protein n=1 Tax=Streptomyces sp. NPDC050732 TaxID=3154632 RepID=UPI003414E7D5